MHRIDTSDRALNLFGTGKDGYTEGDPLSTPATQTSAAHLNALQEEIARVIEGFGGVLDKTNNGQLLAVLRGFPVAVANWFLRTTVLGSLQFRCVAASPSLWVLGGHTGEISTSPDAVTWTATSTGLSQDINGVAWNGTSFVFVGSAGLILTSPDGVTLTPRAASLVSTALRSVAWNGALFVAVGDAGTVLTSPDGVTWTVRTIATSADLLAVTWGGTRWVLVGKTGTIETSTDGITWTARTAAGIVTDLRAVAYNGLLFVAVGQGGTLIVSADGAAWTVQASGTTQGLDGVASDLRGAWLAAGDNGVMVSSFDSSASSWTPRVSTQPTRLAGVAFALGVWVVVGDSGVVLNSLRS